MLENTLTHNSLDIAAQVAADLEKYLSFFPNRSFALRNLSKETGLSEKTLRRLLKKENVPSNQTLFKLYFVFTKADSEDEVLDICPAVIKDRLKGFKPDSFQKIHNKDFDFLEVIKTDPIVGEIYLLLGTKKVDLSHIVYHYGQYGSRALEKLVNLNIAQKVDHSLYTLSPKQPYLNASLLKELGIRMTRTFLKEEAAAIEGTNFIALYAESLNKEGRKKWLEIENNAFQEKMKIASLNEYKGDISVFTFQVTDDFESPSRTLQ